MARLVTVWLVTLLVTLLPLGARSQEESNWLELRPLAAVRLDILFNPQQGVSAKTASRLRPSALDILTGPFFDGESGTVIGLLVVRGQARSPASGRANRGVLAQTRTGELLILTEAKAVERIHALEHALEAAPLMVAEGVRRDYSRDIGSPTFYTEASYRVLVGLTEEGDFFWAVRPGQLGEVERLVRRELAARQRTLRDLLALDGGSSVTETGLRLPPARLVLLPREETVATRTKP